MGSAHSAIIRDLTQTVGETQLLQNQAGNPVYRFEPKEARLTYLGGGHEQTTEPKPMTDGKLTDYDHETNVFHFHFQDQQFHYHLSIQGNPCTECPGAGTDESEAEPALAFPPTFVASIDFYQRPGKIKRHFSCSKKKYLYTRTFTIKKDIRILTPPEGIGFPLPESSPAR